MQAKSLPAKYSSKRPSSDGNDSQDTLGCPGEDKAFSTGAVSAAGGGGMTTVQTRRLGPSRMAVSLPASQRSALPRYQQEPPVRRRITFKSLWCVAEFDALRIRYSDHFPHSWHVFHFKLEQYSVSVQRRHFRMRGRTAMRSDFEQRQCESSLPSSIRSSTSAYTFYRLLI